MVGVKKASVSKRSFQFAPGAYTIRVWGDTLECGVGTITKAQYSYWVKSENEESIGDALDGSYDYTSNKTPKNARLAEDVRSYTDIEDFYGFHEESSTIEITDAKGEKVFAGTFNELFESAHEDEDEASECSEENGEIYPQAFGSGTLLIYKLFGKGCCFQHTLDVAGGLDLSKLKVGKYDVDGDRYINEITYDGDTLDDQGVDEASNNWRGTSSEFSVHHTA